MITLNDVYNDIRDVVDHVVDIWNQVTEIIGYVSGIVWDDITTIANYVDVIDWTDITDIIGYVDSIDWVDITDIKDGITSIIDIFVNFDPTAILDFFIGIGTALRDKLLDNVYIDKFVNGLKVIFIALFQRMVANTDTSFIEDILTNFGDLILKWVNNIR